MIKKSREAVNMGQSSNRILGGSTIEGNISSDGDFRIDGTIKGDIHISGKLVIGEKGKVEGEARCGSANVSGKFSGTLIVDELLTLETTARVEGDVTIAKLSIATGAEFSGSCNMGAVVREMQNNGKASEKQKGAKQSEAS
jgi:cytoskeletal protein CcmA (bactofilin family)